MKKLLAVLALALVASPAYAVITGSAHDLTSVANEELCAYCHTPHAAAAAVAPLWNRTLINPSANYTGTGTFSQNGANDYTGTDVALCLSCHDGATAMNAVVNMPNSVALADATSVANNGVKFVNIGANLSNDHPVGFNFADADTADGEIVDPGFGGAFAGVLTGGGLFQCSSCHDVHNNDNGAFLVMSNANSDLCLACHTK